MAVIGGVQLELLFLVPDVQNVGGNCAKQSDLTNNGRDHIPIPAIQSKPVVLGGIATALYRTSGSDFGYVFLGLRLSS